MELTDKDIQSLKERFISLMSRVINKEELVY